MGEFADAINEFSDFFAKLRADVFLIDAGIFDDVVQKRRHQALRVHVHARKNAGHRQRVRDVRLPTAACLAVMGLLGVIVGAADLLRLIQRQVIGDQLLKGR